jgi:hypothetical protein
MTAEELRDFLVRHQAAFTFKRFDTGDCLFVCNAGNVFTVSKTGTVGCEGTPTDLTRGSGYLRERMGGNAMSQRTQDLLKKDIASGQPASSIGALPPGCSLEETCEQEPVLTPDQPVTYRHHNAHRITGCTDSSDNTDWTYGPWEDGRCPRETKK